ncbi:MAG: cytochrome P450 [Sphingomonadaceae bacterium]|nr:cytochrome P450 [Sphingomonadaceae bacterium]
MATQLKVELDPFVVDNRPDHVPAELVRDLRWALGNFPVTYDEPYKETQIFFEGDVPPLLWTPDAVAGHPGIGAWVVTRYQDIARVYQDAELFSTEGVAAFQSMIGETWPCIPLGIDPPDHMKYRTMLNPFFSPKAIDALEQKIRASANVLIDSFIDKGTVDFAYDFGRVYPVRVFMDLMGFPFTQFEQFLEWENAILHSHDFELATMALRGILAYLREFIAEQRANPGPDLAGKIVTGQVGGRPITDDEIIGTIFFLWLGGLDTVASTLAMIFRRLGLDMAMQQKLRADPELIPDAVEEFLRVQPLVNSHRLVKREFEWYGQTIKQGDWVMALVTAGNFDPAEFDNPREVRFDRQGNRHFTLAGGPHRCLGSHLARRELRVALEEFFRRVPPFKLAANDERLIYPGLRSARNVRLVW